jgi:DNA-binding response OmpR family regulator
MSSKRYRIVCVDDDRDTCDLMEAWLEFAPFEYDVEAVETAAKALELVGRDDADLYILDSSVTGEDPLTLLQTIREKDKTTPILIVSGMAKKIDRSDALAAGANDYITKPAESEDFVAAVERLLLQR